ncbi:hypothetical protein GOA90_25270 [Sinorhizobium meliloti]|nr:hypothetical protein [Sinorhizobium meliloti]
MTPHRETINAHNAAVEREGTDMTDRPAIKALEWREDWGGTLDNIPEWRANTPIGTLTVSIAGHRDENGRRYERHSDVPTDLKSRLIASATDHYASRIRSCLLDKPEAVEGERLESARAEQWRLRREAEAGRDTAKAVAHSFRNERDALRAALSDIIEGWDFWEVNHHDREPPRDAIRRARAALSTPADTDAAQSEIDRLRRELEEARRALEPFARFAENVAYQEGEFSDGFVWQSAIHRESISTWFGPSDFGAAFEARAVLRAVEKGK